MRLTLYHIWHTHCLLGGVSPYCLPRALSRLLLMVSRKSVVFRKCSFSFTLPREHGGGGHHSGLLKAIKRALPRHTDEAPVKFTSRPLLEGHKEFTGKLGSGLV